MTTSTPSTEQPRCVPLLGSIWRDRDRRRSTPANPRFVRVTEVSETWVTVRSCTRDGTVIGPVRTAGVARFRCRFAPETP